ncbi:amidophosphoribosyltransferase [Selenomonadales bacterium OttesenSCG-928-I06]|nr:amidophosphoribosyltransferase [Selenomonadales bacterium OttesenSCG-928-I06]
MFYDVNEDKLKEECGLFGVYSHTKPISFLTYLGLYALQHRGQESAGIAVTNGTVTNVKKALGLVGDVFKNCLPELESQYIATGHVRYSTTGSNLVRNTQPLLVNYSGGQLSLSHNGNLINANELRKELENEGCVFQTSIDSEVIINLIARSRKSTTEEKIIEACQKIKGAFCLVIMTLDKLIAIRDPHGFHPLCLGKIEDDFVVSSESCAFDTVGADFLRDIEPGEMVVIDKDGLKSYKNSLQGTLAKCSFEYVYFARPDSNLDGQNVYEARMNLGATLFKETNIKADIVISVPDSGTPAAIGYSKASGIPYVEGLLKNRYIGRTFIQPDQKNREASVHLKLNVVKSLVKDKSIIMVDDSIVRGTTSARLINMLRAAGAKEVHMCISSPPVLFSCYYGIDINQGKELIATVKTKEEIRQFIGANSLNYISLEGLKSSIENTKTCTLCAACFDGRYPTETPCEKNNKFIFEADKK